MERTLKRGPDGSGTDQGNERVRYERSNDRFAQNPKHWFERHRLRIQRALEEDDTKSRRGIFQSVGQRERTAP